jgi:hypothetical protein
MRQGLTTSTDELSNMRLEKDLRTRSQRSLPRPFSLKH